MGGIVTTNLTSVTGASLASASTLALIDSSARLAVDTGITGGGSPQTAAIIPGTLPAPATQRTLTALAGGAKAGATQLGYGVNAVTVVATDGDSVLMPYAFPGAVCFIANNDAGQDIRAYGKGTDTINGVATATGNLQGEGTGALYIGTAGTGDGTDAGAWQRILTA